MGFQQGVRAKMNAYDTGDTQGIETNLCSPFRGGHEPRTPSKDAILPKLKCRIVLRIVQDWEIVEKAERD